MAFVILWLMGVIVCGALFVYPIKDKVWRERLSIPNVAMGFLALSLIVAALPALTVIGVLLGLLATFATFFFVGTRLGVIKCETPDKCECDLKGKLDAARKWFEKTVCGFETRKSEPAPKTPKPKAQPKQKAQSKAAKPAPARKAADKDAKTERAAKAPAKQGKGAKAAKSIAEILPIRDEDGHKFIEHELLGGRIILDGLTTEQRQNAVRNARRKLSRMLAK